jgi:hypothetical protein
MEGHAVPDDPCSSLPDKSSWRFDAIASSEPDRGLALEMSGTPRALVKALGDALAQAVDRSDVRIGREHAKDQWEDCRAVVQFNVGAQLFDWFFNGRTGYRAHFRAHYACGLGFNSRIIEVLRRCLKARLGDIVRSRELNDEFQDCGGFQMRKDFLINSLEPDLSKVWFCTKRIRPDGGIEMLPTGVVGEPRILLSGGDSWPAPYREGDAAWLDVKGAFLGQAGAYQVKDPIRRARKLQAKGEA